MSQEQPSIFRRAWNAIVRWLDMPRCTLCGKERGSDPLCPQCRQDHLIDSKAP